VKELPWAVKVLRRGKDEYVLVEGIWSGSGLFAAAKYGDAAHGICLV
jgi:hypothetical protein